MCGALLHRGDLHRGSPRLGAAEGGSVEAVELGEGGAGLVGGSGDELDAASDGVDRLQDPGPEAVPVVAHELDRRRRPPVHRDRQTLQRHEQVGDALSRDLAHCLKACPQDDDGARHRLHRASHGPGAAGERRQHARGRALRDGLERGHALRKGPGLPRGLGAGLDAEARRELDERIEVLQRASLLQPGPSLAHELQRESCPLGRVGHVAKRRQGVPKDGISVAQLARRVLDLHPERGEGVGRAAGPLGRLHHLRRELVQVPLEVLERQPCALEREVQALQRLARDAGPRRRVRDLGLQVNDPSAELPDLAGEVRDVAGGHHERVARGVGEGLRRLFGVRDRLAVPLVELGRELQRGLGCLLFGDAGDLGHALGVLRDVGDGLDREAAGRHGGGSGRG